MLISTKIVVDSAGQIVLNECYEYYGVVALCKGDPVAKSAEESQAAFNSTLQTIFSRQYNNQTDILNFLKNPMEANIQNPQGYSPSELASMRTAATDTDAQQYKNAQQALNNNRNQVNGGSDLPSGVDSQLESQLLSDEASKNAADQETITANNANLKQANYWNSVNALNGVSAQLNPTSYASEATSGSGAVSNLSQAVTASSGPTFGSILGGVVGAGLGAAGSYFGAKGH